MKRFVFIITFDSDSILLYVSSPHRVQLVFAAFTEHRRLSTGDS